MAWNYVDFPPTVDVGSLHPSIYDGAVVRFADWPAMQEIVDFVDGIIAERYALGPIIEAHLKLDRPRLIDLLDGLQRDFSGSKEAARLWRRLFESVGLDSEVTMRDRLVLRFQLPVDAAGVTTSGVGAPIGFHRDTWGTNLYAQVNWWAPVYPLAPNRSLAIFPHLWDRVVPNNSAEFDLIDAMQKMRSAIQIRAEDVLPQPVLPVDPGTGVPVLIRPGTVIAFSAQHAHGGLPNRSQLIRVSLEARTLLIADQVAGRGAHNVDGWARWSSPGMFRRVSDGKPLNEITGGPRVVPFLGPWPRDSRTTQRRL